MKLRCKVLRRTAPNPRARVTVFARTAGGWVSESFTYNQTIISRRFLARQIWAIRQRLRPVADEVAEFEQRYINTTAINSGALWSRCK